MSVPAWILISVSVRSSLQHIALKCMHIMKKCLFSMLFNACRQVARGLANVRVSKLSRATFMDDTALRDIRNTVFKFEKVLIDN